MNMKYDAIVVGAGVAGLTASAYLSKSGFKTLLLEKESTCGGLVKTFNRDGFYYDTGIRAIENSGVLLPMIRQLGLEVELLENHVAIGIEDQVIRIENEDSVFDYQALLTGIYPESEKEIQEIIEEIRIIMHYMDVQYGIDNPVFLDFKQDRDYMIKKILPWMFKYIFTAPKIARLNEPVEPFLERFTRNQSLLDIIVQHFFQASPAFFALSYLKLFLEYHYPRGGTGRLIEKLVDFIQAHGGEIRTNTRITRVDPRQKCLTDQDGNVFEYGKLIWAADLKTFYRLIDLDQVTDSEMHSEVLSQKEFLGNKSGNDSVLTLYLAVDVEPGYFAEVGSEHFFYTPSKTGLSAAGAFPYDGDWKAVASWLQKYFELTTYEISIPVLRDPALAPPGQSGLIISTLFDYKVTKKIQENDWYDEFSSLAEKTIIEVLQNSIYSRIKGRIVHGFISSPLTIERVAGTTDGAITGWSFTNIPMPAENRIPRILNAIKTPLRDVYQAGQWTYSPSGFPTAVITGKMAADQVTKDLSRQSGKP
jgi:phytoene dehydrogenase-like protein